MYIGHPAASSPYRAPRTLRFRPKSLSQTAERSFDSAYHAPVLVERIVAALDGRASVLDCTLGGGGHSLALLEHGHRVTGIDRDPAALREASARLAMYADQGVFRAVEGDFTRIDELAPLTGDSFDGILADLGVSSHQLDAAERGFSFRQGVPLDMRMESTGPSAADLLNDESEERLADIFHAYGDEPRARRLAREVVRRRGNARFRTADDFVGAIRGALGAQTGPGDFARLFQAVRIAVNDELAGLERVLPQLRDRLTGGGVLAVIAYHSGEDRIVKHAMRDWSTACHCPPRQPVCTCGGVASGSLVTRKAIVASDEEIAANPRARSAHLRLWRKGA